MRKILTSLAIAATALTATIGMAAEPQQRFVRDGQTYVYTTSTTGDRQLIQGHAYPSGQPFRLVVRGNQVSGVAGGMPVSFRTIDAAGAAGGIEVSAR